MIAAPISSQLCPEHGRVANVALVLELLVVIRQIQIELGEHVLVVGHGKRARLARDVAQIAGGFAKLVDLAVVDVCAKRSADLLIYAADDLASLAGTFDLVRDLGRVLLLGGFGKRQLDIDVYRDLHKRSLRLVGGRPKDVPSAALCDYAAYLLQSGQLTVDHTPTDGEQ